MATILNGVHISELSKFQPTFETMPKDITRAEADDFLRQRDEAMEEGECLVQYQVS